MDSFFVIIVIFYFLFIIYVANQVMIRVWHQRYLNLMLYNLLGLVLLLGLFVLQITLMPANSSLPRTMRIDQTSGLLAFGLTLIGVGLGLGVLASANVRQIISRVVGASGKYDPDSVIHTTAVILCIALVVATLTDYALAGGQSGLAENIESSGVSTPEQLFQGVIFITAAFLGIGFALRRDGNSSLERLGLRLPTRDDRRSGIYAGLVLFVVSIVYAMLWEAVAPQAFKEQTQAADQLAKSVDTLPGIFALTVSAGFSEEILIRGALQPVFGIGLSSGFFVLLHTQYLGTPTMVWLFTVSVVFGLIRRRYSTSAAIIAHLVYNAVPLILNYLLVLTSSPSGGA